MLHIDNYLIDHVLVPSVILFFLFWGIVAVAVGAGLIFSTAATLRFFGAMNYYVSTRHAFKPLAATHNVEAPAHKHRRVFGVFVVAGAAYSMFGLLMRFDTDAIVAAYRMNFPAEFVAWLVEALRWSMVAFTAFALVIGIMLVFFPVALKRLEKYLNRWYSVRQVTQGVDNMNLTLDNWVVAFPRAFGSVIVLAALFVVADSAILFWKLY